MIRNDFEDFKAFDINRKQMKRLALSEHDYEDSPSTDWLGVYFEMGCLP